MGRIASEQRTIAGVSKSMSYSYNLDGSLKTATYPSGAVITYTPSGAGRMLSAVDTTNTINYVTSATYTPDGALDGFVNGSGGATSITNSFSYNKRLQPLAMSASTPSATVFSIGYDFHFGNGDNGNVYGITNYKDTTRNQTFTYDPLNRLISAQNAGTDCTKTTANGRTEYWGNNYAYDAWGNLLGKSVTKCSAENAVLTINKNNQPMFYSYDAAGNMLSDGIHSYTFDQENRITSAAGYTYTYDADGNRVKKSNGSTGTLYWYMTPGVVAETDLSGNNPHEYVFFNGERVARKDSNGLVYYYFSDHLKTASVVTDSAGGIRAESDYYPWGGELQITANDSNHYKFTGKERDSETGLDNFGKRYLGSSLGRFITPDAFFKDSHVGDPQSWNKYAYARNNPLRYVDPTGENATVSTSCSTANNQTTCNVNISASIAIYAAPGSGLTQDQLNGAATTIQNSIQSAWSGSFTQDGVTYNVSTQVNVQVAGSESAASKTGAQNVIGLSNGPVNAKDDALTGPSNSLGTFFRGQDAGIWNYNNLETDSPHEFTHLLGVDDKPGFVLSNTNPDLEPSHATAADLRWGVQEAVDSVNLTRAMMSWGCHEAQCGSVNLPTNPAINTNVNVGAPSFGWWK